MHALGTKNGKVTKLLTKYDKRLQEMAGIIKNYTLVISADHGQTNVSREILLNDIPELTDCLIVPPFIEPRAASFYIIPDMKDKFVQRFHKHLSKYYMLFSKQEVFDMKLLGLGSPHPKVMDFLGDYFACSYGDVSIHYKTINQVSLSSRFIGQHSGLMEDEMIVPVVIKSS